MKFSEELWEELEARARKILVRIPRITDKELGESLNIDKNTANQLKARVYKKSAERIKKQVIEKEVGKVEEEFEEIALELWKIVNNNKKEIRDKDGNVIGYSDITDRDKVSAVKALIENKKTLFQIKFDAGVFSRKIGELDVNEIIFKLKENGNRSNKRIQEESTGISEQEKPDNS
jgi:hypothetical protein